MHWRKSSFLDIFRSPYSSCKSDHRSICQWWWWWREKRERDKRTSLWWIKNICRSVENWLSFHWLSDEEEISLVLSRKKRSWLRSSWDSNLIVRFYQWDPNRSSYLLMRIKSKGKVISHDFDQVNLFDIVQNKLTMTSFCFLLSISDHLNWLTIPVEWSGRTGLSFPIYSVG